MTEVTDLEKDFKYLLLSYPRSGSNWLRYCVEFLTKEPTVGPEHLSTKLNQPYGTRCKIGVDLTLDYIIFRAHETNPDTYKKPLILLLRNYKECIPRHNLLCQNSREEKVINVFIQGCTKYTKLLKWYSNYKHKKTIIYYEDLISNPGLELEKLLKFLDRPTTHLSSFIKNYEDHKSKSVKQYSDYVQKSQTRGNKEQLIYHSKNYSKEALVKIDNVIQKDIPKVFQQYLKRYQEGEQ